MNNIPFKKSKHYKSLLTILGGAFLCIVFLSSCKNFLNAGEVKNQIDEAIAYANSQNITLQIENDGQGLITPNGSVTKKIGYDFEIVFKPDTNNYSVNPAKLLKAVDYYDHTKIYNSDEVSFSTAVQSDEDKLAGLYRISVNISKEIKNLLIIPACTAIPHVESFYPPFDNAGYPQDTTIQITFTSPVELSDFVDGNGHLTNIDIFENSTNLLQTSSGNTPYYSNPYLSEDGTKLMIPVTPGKFLIPDNSTTRFRNITVTLSLQNIADKAGIPFKKADYSYSYRVNSDKDNDPPEFKKLYIARTKEDALNGTNLISLNNSYSDFSKNSSVCYAHINEHHVKDFWIYFEAEDTGSGVSCLEIKEQQLYATNATESIGEELTQTIVNSDITGKSFSGLYNVAFVTAEDGLISVEFALKDCANNYNKPEDKKKVLLLKDSCINSFASTINGRGLQLINNSNHIDFSFQIRYTDPSYFWAIRDGGFRMCGEKFEGSFLNNNLEVVSVEYGYDLQNLISYSLESSSGPNIDCTVDDIDPTKNLYIKSTIKDIVGNQVEKINTVYSVQNISSYEKTTDNKLVLYGIDENSESYGYFELHNKYGTLFKQSLKAGEIPWSNKLTYEIEEITWDDGTKSSISDLYTTYSGGGSLWVTPVTGSYMGQTFKIDLTKTKPDSLSADLPDFTVGKLPPVKNSGKTRFKVSNFKKSNGDNFEGNAGYNYYIKCYKTDDEANAKYQKIWSFTNPVTIEVENKIGTYNFKILASYNGTEKSSSSPKSIDVTGSDDSTPPDVGIKKGYSEDTCIWWEPSTNRLVVKDFIDEDGSGLPEEDFEDEYGVYKRVPIKYCYNNSNSNNTVNWNADYIKTAYYYTKKISGKGSYDPHMLAPYIEFPRDGSKGKEFHAFVQDKNGNSKEYHTNTTPETYFIICEEEIGALKRGDIYNPLDGKEISIEYAEKKEWKFTTQMGDKSSIAISSKLSNPKYFKFAVEYQAAEKTSFIRIKLRYMKGSAMVKNIAAKPLYYCPAFYDSNSSITCNLKGTYETSMGLAILADPGSPVLAHTFYCSTNLGNNPEEWLYYGMETGVRSEKGGFTYTSGDLQYVPDGMYYATVVHYADGSMCMTDVKKM